MQMKTYFDLEATFKGYVVGAIVPSDIDLFVFDCQSGSAIDIYFIPAFVATDNTNPERVKQWRKFQHILQKAYIDSRICFLIDDNGNRIRRSIEQKYADTWERERFWYGKEAEVITIEE